MSDELKPCPFCGAPAKIYGPNRNNGALYVAWCTNNSGCDAGATGYGDTPEEATEQWNKRPIEDALRAENEFDAQGEWEMSKNPHRAYTLYAQIGADTPQEMVRALKSIIFDIEADDMPPERITGGAGWGGIFAYLTDADMTHDVWEAHINQWLAERKEAGDSE